jgi:hypothetical protein
MMAENAMSAGVTAVLKKSRLREGRRLLVI